MQLITVNSDRYMLPNVNFTLQAVYTDKNT